MEAYSSCGNVYDVVKNGAVQQLVIWMRFPSPPLSHSPDGHLCGREHRDREQRERDQFMWVNREGGADPRKKRSV